MICTQWGTPPFNEVDDPEVDARLQPEAMSVCHKDGLSVHLFEFASMKKRARTFRDGFYYGDCANGAQMPVVEGDNLAVVPSGGVAERSGRLSVKRVATMLDRPVTMMTCSVAPG